MKLVVGISGVSSKKMRSLNRTFRGVNEVTNVLSFSFNESLPEGGLFLGEIVVCPPKKCSDEELMRLLRHGFKNLWKSKN